MSKKFLAFALASLVSTGALADEFATPKEAEAMVAKTVKSLGADRAGTIKAIIAKDKAYIDRAVMTDLANTLAGAVGSFKVDRTAN